LENIQLTARFLIHKGKEDEFKNIANQCLKIVNEKEKNTTLQYDWYFDAEGNECVIRETYADSNAIMLHLENLGELIGQFLQIADFYPEIYGNPSEEFLKAVEGMNPKIYSFYQGL